MIHNLSLAVQIRNRLHRTEFVVSKEVFLEVLRERAKRGETGVLLLNRSQCSFRYRFLNRASLDGMLFIHPSHEFLSAAEAASQTA